MIGQHLCPFFWDIDTQTFDPQAYPRYTIARLLEYGDTEAIMWMNEQFSRSAIEEVLRGERALSPRSATFWGLVYRIPTGEIAALQSRAGGSSVFSNEGNPS